MESLNQALFLQLNAPAHPGAATLALAVFCARWLVWLIPALLGLGWLRGGEATRRTMLTAAASGALALLVNVLIGLVWTHPRPFMIPLGHTLIRHAADSSFPSDHLALWWAVAFSFPMQRSLSKLGAVLALLGLPVAWARIYLGVHFPLDMLGAAGVAAFAAWATTMAPAAAWLASLHRLAEAARRRLLGKA